MKPSKATTMQFGAELRLAMRQRDMTQAELGRQLNTHHTIICNWTKGRVLPTHESVLKMADILMWDGLVSRSLAARTSLCVICGASCVSFSRSHTTRLYCGDACQRAGYDIRNGIAKQRNNAIRDHRLRDLQEALAKHCFDCAPEGICRNEMAPSNDEDCRFIKLTPLKYGARIRARDRA